MGVYIKDMKMPENCSECPVALCGKYCRINKTNMIYRTLPIRPEHCPLVEIPKGHGRLIDTDDIYVYDEYNILKLKMELTEDEAPTIVEAE